MNLSDDDAFEEPRLELTPMIDVIFQLLIFFMVATTFQDEERELDVDLPKAETGSSLAADLDEIVINLKRDGGIVVSGQTVDEDGLARLLASAAERDPETPVTIRGDRLVHHENVVAVMDACGLAGLTALSLGTMETP